jgi:hypothetical protein
MDETTGPCGRSLDCECPVCDDALPSWEECAAACASDTASALHRFIHMDEPAHDPAYRPMLWAMLREHEAALRARAEKAEALLGDLLGMPEEEACLVEDVLRGEALTAERAISDKYLAVAGKDREEAERNVLWLRKAASLFTRLLGGVSGENALATALRERDEARATNRDLHRRVQAMESLAPTGAEVLGSRLRSEVHRLHALVGRQVGVVYRYYDRARTAERERDEARAERDAAQADVADKRESADRANQTALRLLRERDARPDITPEDALRVLVLAMRRDDDGVAAEERVDAALRAHAERAGKGVKP